MSEKPDYENGQPKPISNNQPSMHDLVINDVVARKDYGLKKYDSLLQPYNGRNFLQDAYEEVQDLIVYLRGSIEEQKIVEFFFKHTLEAYKEVSEKLYPEATGPLMTAGNMPGWMKKICEEVLGDRFEYDGE